MGYKSPIIMLVYVFYAVNKTHLMMQLWENMVVIHYI